MNPDAAPESTRDPAAPARRAGWRRVAPLAGAVLLAALTARLGLWQLDRAAQKLAIQQAQTERGAAPVLDGASLAPPGADARTVAAQLQRRVSLHGRWLASRTVYLDNRPMDGRVGFYVVTPLQLDDGSAVLVERGWLPRDFEDRTRIVGPPTPADTVVTVDGRLAPGPSRLYALGADDAGPIRQNLDPDRYAREIGVPLRPLTVRQTGEAADGLRRRWPPPAADVQKHYGYAFQWFALCALTITLYVWFRILRPRRDARSRA